MPELAEVKICSDFINQNSKGRTFNCVNHIDNNNRIIKPIILEEFKLSADTNGKELILNLQSGSQTKKVWVFMGMNGNWKFVSTDDWVQSKYIRLRIDSNDGRSLILYGGFMGPKYSLKPFTSKRGPDPTKNFEDFKDNIYINIDKKTFNKPIGEALLDQKYFNGIGAYLTAEIIGRLDIDPFRTINNLSKSELDNLLEMIFTCCNESYQFGGGELRDWFNPFGESRIKEWIQYYGNKKDCYKQKFGTRNIWINKKFKPS